MNHLAPDEFIDWLDDTLDGRRAAHVAACDRCRAIADELRLAQREARETDASEPPAAFWEQQATGIRARLDADPPSRRWVQATFARISPASWASAAGVVVALGLGALWWGDTGDESRDAGARVGEQMAETFVEEWGATAGWEVVVAAASGLEWDESIVAGFDLQPGTADEAVGGLSRAELAELVRLLEAEVGPPVS